MSKNNIPSTSKTSFDCPHCGAFAHQKWYKTYIRSDERQNTPSEIYTLGQNHLKNSTEQAKKILHSPRFIPCPRKRDIDIANVHSCYISECYSCKKLTLWIHDKIVYPNIKFDIKPNSDLPLHIQKLFNEAREIVDLSPKGAAAILRLCLEYLCKSLGGSGKINDDIAKFLEKGLSPTIIDALDIVRVMGNEAVHSGKINLDDNKDIAFKLFKIVNFICEKMITEPREIEEMNARIPENKQKGIQDRNQKANKKRDKELQQNLQNDELIL